MKKRSLVKLRRVWTIKPVERVVPSKKTYSRQREKQRVRRERNS
jgi:hypothetical protein